MPNPLLSALNRVQTPREPKPIDPVTEEYKYVDYDGLGETELTEGPQAYSGGAIPVHRDPPPADPDPIAVSIVVDETRSREFTEWGGYVTTIDNNPQRIVSREKRRTRVKITNLDTAITLWIGPTPSVTKWGGVPIGPGKSEELTSTEAVYGVADAAVGVNINVSVLNHWSVNVDK